MGKRIIQASQVLSLLFSPFYAPLWAFVWLFSFSRFQIMTWSYRLYILAVVFLFTILVPRLTINLFRRLNQWTHWQLGHRRHRHMPYVLTLLSYATCLAIFLQSQTNMFFCGIIMAAIVAQLLCSVINLWWKISTHMVGMGGLVGMVLAFSYTFFFNPTWLLCGLLILSGMLGTSRMVLRQHSLSQVLVGFLLGFCCAMLFLIFRWNLFV